MSFARNIASSQAIKRARDTLLKQGKEAAAKAGKRALSKGAEATGDLVGQKIADKITKKAKPEKSVGSVVTQVKKFSPEERRKILKELALISKV